jgi:hypothetical protein
MARNTQEAIEKTEDALDKKLEPFVGELTVATKPVVIIGVQRKINIGNYETIDVYCAVSIPQDDIDPSDKEAIKNMIKEAAEIGFAATSEEVSARYKFIKESGKS